MQVLTQLLRSPNIQAPRPNMNNDGHNGTVDVNGICNKLTAKAKDSIMNLLLKNEKKLAKYTSNDLLMVMYCFCGEKQNTLYYKRVRIIEEEIATLLNRMNVFELLRIHYMYATVSRYHLGMYKVIFCVYLYVYACLYVCIKFSVYVCLYVCLMHRCTLS